MLSTERLKSWLERLDSDSTLQLEMDCFHGTAYLKTKTKLGWERINLTNSSIEGLITGRMSSVRGSIQEIDRIRGR